MDNKFPGIKDLIHQLESMEKRKKPKMLVVDDEPDNLDLLYRTFRRDFRVFKAESGANALEVLASEGEVAVIISDQRMPEMKGTEFLSKTVPDFPNTVRIILTGFTDVEDLVDAINSGQVYKYITKPWEPKELKVVVDRAAETYKILKQRTEELERAQAQTNILATITQVAQKSDSRAACLQPIAQVMGDNFAAQGCSLQLTKDNNLTGKTGGFGVLSSLDSLSLVTEAITSGETKIWLNSSSDGEHPEAEIYRTKEIKVHLVIPLVFRQELLSVLSLVWTQAKKIQEDELILLDLCAQQVALALASIRDAS